MNNKDNNSGWIKLHRSIMEDKFYFEEPFTRISAWIDLLLLASYKKRYMMIRGIEVEVERGQVGKSRETLAERWGWSRGKVDRFLKRLEALEIIEQQKNGVIHLISIRNYDRYQQNDASNGAIDGATNGHKQESKEYKEKEKPPKGGKKKSELFFLPPTQEEVDAYVAEKGLRMDGAAFFDHFTANGWKVGGKAAMRDWKAAVRNWARNQPNFKRQTLNDDGTTKTDRQRAEDEYNAEFERYVRAKLAGDGVQE